MRRRIDHNQDVLEKRDKEIEKLEREVQNVSQLTINLKHLTNLFIIGKEDNANCRERAAPSARNRRELGEDWQRHHEVGE